MRVDSEEKQAFVERILGKAFDDLYTKYFL